MYIIHTILYGGFFSQYPSIIHVILTVFVVEITVDDLNLGITINVLAKLSLLMLNFANS